MHVNPTEQAPKPTSWSGAVVVWTNDDISYGKAPQLRRQLAFLDRYGIKGVFFVIPSPGGSYRGDDCSGNERDLDRDPDLMRVIHRAREDGHEFYPHGYRHHAYECGIPELEMLAAGPQEVRDDFDLYRSEIEKGHDLPVLIEMLENTHRIWRRAFGETPRGFRPGWGAYCRNLYTALAQTGYQWVSSRLPSMSAYQRANGKDVAGPGFRAAIPCGPHRLESGIWEIPFVGDYSYRVPREPEAQAEMLKLAFSEISHLVSCNQPVVLVTHWHGLEYSGSDTPLADPQKGTGYEVQAQLIEMLLGQNGTFAGMNALFAGLEHNPPERLPGSSRDLTPSLPPLVTL